MGVIFCLICNNIVQRNGFFFSLQYADGFAFKKQKVVCFKVSFQNPFFYGGSRNAGRVFFSWNNTPASLFQHQVNFLSSLFFRQKVIRHISPRSNTMYRYFLLSEVQWQKIYHHQVDILRPVSFCRDYFFAFFSPSPAVMTSQ